MSLLSFGAGSKFSDSVKSGAAAGGDGAGVLLRSRCWLRELGGTGARLFFLSEFSPLPPPPWPLVGNLLKFICSHVKDVGFKVYLP